MLDANGKPHFGRWIIEQRVLKGWSQQELAQRLDLSQQAVSFWESREKAVNSPGKIRLLHQLFGVPLETSQYRIPLPNYGRPRRALKQQLTDIQKQLLMRVEDLMRSGRLDENSCMGLLSEGDLTAESLQQKVFGKLQSVAASGGMQVRAHA